MWEIFIVNLTCINRTSVYSEHLSILNICLFWTQNLVPRCSSLDRFHCIFLLSVTCDKYVLYCHLVTDSMFIYLCVIFQIDIADISDSLHVFAVLPPSGSSDGTFLSMEQASVYRTDLDPRVSSFGRRILSSNEDDIFKCMLILINLQSLFTS